VLPHTPNNPLDDSAEHQARVHAIRERLRPLLEQTATDMAEALAELSDDQLFGQIEFTLRDRAHRFATAAHQAGIDARQKKTATTAPASSAATAAKTPSSSTTSPGPS
jgi:hypothetical protein